MARNPSSKNGRPARCEVQSANVEVKTVLPFVIRSSSIDIFPARRLAIMNLALRGIEADFGPEHADTFRRDLHPGLRADTATRVSAKPKSRSHLAGLLRSERQLPANPPFNDSDWLRKDDDVRWQFGVPPKGNGNPLSVNASN
jgi:hypothetical protein